MLADGKLLISMVGCWLIIEIVVTMLMYFSSMERAALLLQCDASKLVFLCGDIIVVLMLCLSSMQCCCCCCLLSLLFSYQAIGCNTNLTFRDNKDDST